MGLNSQLQQQHSHLFKVIDEQEAAAIAEIREKFTVMRYAVDEAFGIERMVPKPDAELEVVADASTDTESPVLGATS